jgi:hypothetical protein
MQDELKKTLYSLVESTGHNYDPAILAEVEKMRTIDRIVAHLTTIIKNRTIVLTGDTSHLSVRSIIQCLADIDKPKKYDFQDDDVNEQEFLSELLSCVPTYIMRGEVTNAQVIDAIDGKEWLELPESRESKCYDCAQPFKVAFKGNEVHITAGHACEQNHTFTIEVDFPTGEVVFDDWPARFSEARDAGFIFENKKESVNYLKGQRQRSDEMAAQQIVHHSVGNTCPTFYVNKETGAIQIGSHWDEKLDGYATPEGMEDVGSFCTDLWWVTMLDRKFYDTIVGKLPQQKSKKYYDKELHIAHIPPGRYRFTCYGRTEEGMNMFMTGERIGDASDFMPPFDVLASKRLMTLDEATFKYLSMWGKPRGNPLSARFRFLDYVFNTIGNGLRSKGELFNAYSIANDAVGDVIPPSDDPLDKKNPYPNFKKEYSTIYSVPLKDMPTDWLEGVLWYYEECKTYFENGAEGYSYAYPSKQNRDDELAKYIEKYRKDGQSEEEYFAAVSNAYECEFRGDIPDFQTRRWEKEKARILDFISNTMEYIKEELDKRS